MVYTTILLGLLSASVVYLLQVQSELHFAKQSLKELQSSSAESIDSDDDDESSDEVTPSLTSALNQQWSLGEFFEEFVDHLMGNEMSNVTMEKDESIEDRPSNSNSTTGNSTVAKFSLTWSPSLMISLSLIRPHYVLFLKNQLFLKNHGEEVVLVDWVRWIVFPFLNVFTWIEVALFLFL